MTKERPSDRAVQIGGARSAEKKKRIVMAAGRPRAARTVPASAFTQRSAETFADELAQDLARTGDDAGRCPSAARRGCAGLAQRHDQPHPAFFARYVTVPSRRLLRASERKGWRVRRISPRQICGRR